MAQKLNINVGILGHVDCGKTSLARALSTTFSTASLDKSSESRKRGITLDLGFSVLTLPLPSRLKDSLSDCPGHASLIRTIIGGAQIIDFMILVIDFNKGITKFYTYLLSTHIDSTHIDSFIYTCRLYT